MTHSDSAAPRRRFLRPIAWLFGVVAAVRVALVFGQAILAGNYLTGNATACATASSSGRRSSPRRRLFRCWSPWPSCSPVAGLGGPCW